ncbi:hypothetical protein PRJ_Fausto_00458 [Faustovirus]|nr:hypothetical protein PRJ_Fausto_00458 [Faustovirus]QBR99363.1 hypothetical protein [Faustovirus mariensis]
MDILPDDLIGEIGRLDWKVWNALMLTCKKFRGKLKHLHNDMMNLAIKRMVIRFGSQVYVIRTLPNGEQHGVTRNWSESVSMSSEHDICHLVFRSQWYRNELHGERVDYCTGYSYDHHPMGQGVNVVAKVKQFISRVTKWQHGIMIESFAPEKIYF